MDSNFSSKPLLNMRKIPLYDLKGEKTKKLSFLLNNSHNNTNNYSYFSSIIQRTPRYEKNISHNQEKKYSKSIDNQKALLNNLHKTIRITNHFNYNLPKFLLNTNERTNQNKNENQNVNNHNNFTINRYYVDNYNNDKKNDDSSITDYSFQKRESSSNDLSSYKILNTKIRSNNIFEESDDKNLLKKKLDLKKNNNKFENHYLNDAFNEIIPNHLNKIWNKNLTERKSDNKKFKIIEIGRNNNISMNLNHIFNKNIHFTTEEYVNDKDKERLQEKFQDKDKDKDKDEDYLKEEDDDKNITRNIDLSRMSNSNIVSLLSSHLIQTQSYPSSSLRSLSKPVRRKNSLKKVYLKSITDSNINNNYNSIKNSNINNTVNLERNYRNQSIDKIKLGEYIDLRMKKNKNISSLFGKSVKNDYLLSQEQKFLNKRNNLRYFNSTNIGKNSFSCKENDLLLNDSQKNKKSLNYNYLKRQHLDFCKGLVESAQKYVNKHKFIVQNYFDTIRDDFNKYERYKDENNIDNLFDKEIY